MARTSPADRRSASLDGLGRSHGQGRRRAMGRAPRRRAAADRQHPADRAHADPRTARLRRRRVVGAGRGRRVAGPAAARRSPASASPISAPRPAARPPSSRPPAPTFWRSTARPSAWCGLRRTWPASVSRSRPARSTAEKLDEPPFDAILLDAPCSATGTIRRHPDVTWTKGEDDLRKLTALQSRLLDKAGEPAQARRAARLLHLFARSRGGRESGRGLSGPPSRFRRASRSWPPRSAGLAKASPPQGDLRTLPFHLDGAEQTAAGVDGFFAARFVRNGS